MTTVMYEWGDSRIRGVVWKNIHPEPNTGCWLWSGYINGDGYGRGYPVAGGKLTMAHRITFEALVRPVQYPDEELDHRCVTRACVNPAHLEAVSHHVNVLRMAAAITHCKHGHEYTPENTAYGTGGGRVCLVCRKIKNTEQMQKARATPEARERTNRMARESWARRKARSQGNVKVSQESSEVLVS